MPDSLTRILCAEDDPDIRMILRASLESIGGFTVQIAENGRAALEQAPAFAPDLVLLDVMMPEMDGPTTFEALRATPDLADLPVIFLTAKTQPEEVEAYLALGIDDVIQKPFDPITLPTQVRTIWTHAHA